jgi:NADPH-dependent 2,4-dienoyl-CoA reductase/sulfur reductase-like enzyme/rhodanese-related sulfurtransferase
MSAAARARRLSEEADIAVYERGPHVSFANCGLPYHVGGEIRDQAALVVQTPEAIRARFRVDVRTRHEVLGIDRERKVLRVRDLVAEREFEDDYDALILATGATALRLPIPGLERAGHFWLRTIPEMEALEHWIAEKAPKRAVVVGGGFIGLETAEQLQRRRLDVTLVEAAPQVLAPVDADLAGSLADHLREKGVGVRLSAPVEAFEAPGDDGPMASIVKLPGGETLEADVVVLALGVRPRVELAVAAGIALGESGGIHVDAGMRTSDPSIYAVGDAVEVLEPVTDTRRVMPLAGPANRQGRVAAANALGGSEEYPGTLGTSIVRVFDLVAGGTGANRRALEAAGIPFQSVHVHRGHHVSYYPGSRPLTIVLHFTPDEGRLLGGQVLGELGVDKRVDVLATALRAGMTVRDLADLELAYSPPFGSAKDPINIAGMVATNLLDGLLEMTEAPGEATVLDVRGGDEVEALPVPGAVNIPLNSLRDRIAELDRDTSYVVTCRSGQRAYYAHRILAQRDFESKVLDGGVLSKGPEE